MHLTRADTHIQTYMHFKKASKHIQTHAHSLRPLYMHHNLWWAERKKHAKEDDEEDDHQDDVNEYKIKKKYVCLPVNNLKFL